jgi:hypothetical protein
MASKELALAAPVGPSNTGNSSIGRTALTTFECNTSPNSEAIVKHLHTWH